MCRISLNFSYFETVGYFEIQKQIRDVRRELELFLNNDIPFTYCEIEKCSVGLTEYSLCPIYKYVYYTKVIIFKVFWSVANPHYRLRARAYDVITNTYVPIKNIT